MRFDRSKYAVRRHRRHTCGVAFGTCDCLIGEGEASYETARSFNVVDHGLISYCECGTAAPFGHDGEMVAEYDVSFEGVVGFALGRYTVANVELGAIGE